jgi:Chitobiase/beta-hexosaminidase C-terminal domain
VRTPWCEFKANPGEYAFAGLGVGDGGVNWAEIDYAFYMYPTGTVAIYENGVWREGVSATFTGADVLRVAVEDGVVRYRKNGTLIYTSAVPPAYPLRVDTSFHRVGGTIHSAVIAGTLTWVGAARPVFTPSPGNYTSSQSITATSATPGAVIRYTVDGTEPAPSSPTIGSVTVLGPFTQLKARAWVSGLVTSPVQSGHYSIGPLTTEPVIWTHLVNAVASGSTVSKAGGGAAAWDSGAASTQSIVSSDGYVEFKANPGEYAFAGLSAGDGGVNWAEIDFAFYAYPTGALAIYENGVWREGVSAAYVAGDTLRVAVEGGVVKYRKNGVLIYTSSIAPTFPLLVDTSFHRPGASIQQAVINGNLLR